MDLPANLVLIQLTSLAKETVFCWLKALASSFYVIVSGKSNQPFDRHNNVSFSNIVMFIADFVS